MGGKNSYESIKRYEDKAYDKVLVRMPKGQKEIIQAHAEANGESVNGFINRAIGEAMGTNPRKGHQEPAGAHGGSGYILTPTAAKTAQEAAQRAGETVPAFVERAVETQAQRDKVAQSFTKGRAGE